MKRSKMKTKFAQYANILTLLFTFYPFFASFYELLSLPPCSGSCRKSLVHGHCRKKNSNCVLAFFSWNFFFVSSCHLMTTITTRTQKCREFFGSNIFITYYFGIYWHQKTSVESMALLSTHLKHVISWRGARRDEDERDNLFEANCFGWLNQ